MSPQDNDSASSSLSPVAVATPAATGMDIDEKEKEKVNDAEDSDSSLDEHQPPPAPAIPTQSQVFGEDPSTFPDPTNYEIPDYRSIKDIPRSKKKEIFSVAYFPEEDLENLIPGTPPDKDFSNAKPTNQVQSNTFATYLEPYFRPYTEEDLAFLRERGDRATPFEMPPRGTRHYTEIWAHEDKDSSSPTKSDGLELNEPRGDITTMDDAIAATDQVSLGPIAARLLATMRPEHRAPPAEERVSTNGFTNGEANINGDVNGDLGEPSQSLNDAPAPRPPATFMPDSNSESWKKMLPVSMTPLQIETRLKEELRFIGFMPPEDPTPVYNAHYDDEIAARLRYLQGRLREVSIKNGARKARIQEMVKERMAHQEFSTIMEDLDSQVQAGYAKRTRTLGKSKKSKRPGGAGGGSHFVAGATGMARPGIGDATKTVMDRRTKWQETVGPVLDQEANQVRRSKDPGSSIFKPEDMAVYMKREKESWDDDQEEE